MPSQSAALTAELMYDYHRQSYITLSHLGKMAGRVLQSAATLSIIMIAGGNHTLLSAILSKIAERECSLPAIDCGE